MVDAVVRLFLSTATTFESNGLGFLPDIISCEVVEERNGIFELTMTYPITGRLYPEIITRRILVAKSNPFSDPQPFRIYEISKPIKGKVTICAEHISYDLIGIPVKPFSAPNVIMALKGLKDNALINCPFNFMTDKSTAATYVVPVPSNIRTELGGVQGSILDTYRGEYEFNGYQVNLWNNRGMNRGATIRYGKNLTDLQQDENVADLYTGVLPYWYSDLEENGGLVRGTIVNCPGTYNFQRIMVLDCSYEFQDKPTVAQLTTFAQSYISNNNIGVPKVSIEVSFIDLGSSEEYQDVAQLTTVHLCDTVAVEYSELGVKASGKCIKTKYNVLEDRYNSVEIGDARPDLTVTLASNNDKLADDFQKKLISTIDTTKEEFQNNLAATYTELLGDITDLGNHVNEQDTSIRNDMASADQLLRNDLIAQDAAIRNAMNTADQNLRNDMNSQDQKLQNNLTESEKKFQNDLSQMDKDLKSLINKTAEDEATSREEAIANATKKITGNLGGYVVLHSSTNADYPDEILVMDTDKVTTAKKIWRWNKSGLGYSSVGYNGPYGLAITQDGAIVADYIKAGAINASLITTGFMSASIIQGGTLILGGASNGNGNFVLRDNNNNAIGYMSNAGFSIYKGTIMGPAITVGGLNNVDGYIKVLDGDGTQVALINNAGLKINKGSIAGPNITVGGSNNTNGYIRVLDANGTQVALMNNAGLNIQKGTIKGPSITIGGASNTNGTIAVLNSSGNNAGVWNNAGLTLYQNASFTIYASAADKDGNTVERITEFNNGIKMTYGGTEYFSISPTSTTSDGKRFTTGFQMSVADAHLPLRIGYQRRDVQSVIKIDPIGFAENFIGGYTTHVGLELDASTLMHGVLYFIGPDYDYRNSSSTIYAYLRGTPSIGTSGTHGNSVWFDYVDDGYCYSDGKIYVRSDETKFEKLIAAGGGLSPLIASAFNTTSTRREKENIEPMTDEEAKKLLEIEVVTFDYKERNNGINCRGVIAEDVFEIIEWPVWLDKDGIPQSVDYSKFAPYLIKMVQILQQEVDELKGEIQKLKE